MIEYRFDQLSAAADQDADRFVFLNTLLDCMRRAAGASVPQRDDIIGVPNDIAVALERCAPLKTGVIRTENGERNVEEFRDVFRNLIGALRAAGDNTGGVFRQIRQNILLLIQLDRTGTNNCHTHISHLLHPLYQGGNAGASAASKNFCHSVRVIS